MSAANWAAVKTAHQTALATALAAGDLDTAQYQEALALLDDWISAQSAVSDVLSTPVGSYSIGGRNITRAQHSAMLQAASDAKARYYEAIHGDITYADISAADEATGV